VVLFFLAGTVQGMHSGDSGNLATVHGASDLPDTPQGTNGGTVRPLFTIPNPGGVSKGDARPRVPNAEPEEKATEPTCNVNTAARATTKASGKKDKIPILDTDKFCPDPIPFYSDMFRELNRLSKKHEKAYGCYETDHRCQHPRTDKSPFGWESQKWIHQKFYADGQIDRGVPIQLAVF